MKLVSDVLCLKLHHSCSFGSSMWHIMVTGTKKYILKVKILKKCSPAKLQGLEIRDCVSIIAPESKLAPLKSHLILYTL